jgi:hypothetical protein
MERVTKVYLPKWAVALYAFLAIALIPWIVDLSTILPRHHSAQNWDTLWVGFDIIMLVTILITIYLIYKRTIWVVVSASALATLFIVDVWFDVLTAKPGKELHESLGFGVIELSLAFITYRMVYKIIHNSTTKKVLKVTHKK